jgi:formate dehydrogenase major subunit
MAPKTGKHEWEIVAEIAALMGAPMPYDNTSQIMDEIAATTPTFTGVSFDLLDKVGSVQWPCNAEHPLGTETMHEGEFARGKGHFVQTPYVATTERSTRKYPLILTTGRILSQYNVGAQTRRTDNVAWHPEDLLEIHPHDAEDRGIREGDIVTLASRVGETRMRAKLADRMPVGVVYTTFHHPVSGANVVTTENSDWATNCPEYKVTAVQVGLAVGPEDAEMGNASAVVEPVAVS